ncbi:MAG: OadG family transporter subunit [Faecalimonas sp.]|nr:OadG family transporter subunit [Faecalimonas sp.]
MKRKICLCLCVLVAMLSLAACSGQKKGTSSDVETMKASADFIIENFSQMADEELEQFKSVSEFQLDYTMMSTGLKIDGATFIGMINSWNAAEDECGVYKSHGDYTVEEKAKEVVISTLAEYEERDATMAFTFDNEGNMKSLDVSAKFSAGEILTKAGLNTVLGMGTVFAVLIFLAFVIGLMKYIPALLEGKAAEAAPQKKEEPVAVVKAPVPAVVSETEDLELIAVITAAIAMQEGVSPDGFVVRSIRRRPSNNWK